MRSKSGPQSSADEHVREIRRATRKQYSSEEKIRIVLEARELVKHYAVNDLKKVQEFDRRSEEASEDPLEQLLEFLKLFETYISNSDDPAPGCMYAVFTYESRQFDPDVLDLVSDTLRQWTSIYVRKFQKVMDRYQPALPVSPRQLAEMIVSVIEGGLVLQRAHGDTDTTRRQSEQFRNYLKLLFPRADTPLAA
jgi:TetR/AcrR family transcriptional repressor of nem operon